MNLVISLDKEVEPNFINLAGKFAKEPSFYKQPCDATLPTLVVVIGCMVKCATEGILMTTMMYKSLNEV